MVSWNNLEKAQEGPAAGQAAASGKIDGQQKRKNQWEDLMTPVELGQ